MKTTKEKVKVQFLHNLKSDEIFAFFPEMDFNSYFKTAYAQTGQHSACSTDYAKESIAATPEQYEALKLELETIGYELEIIEA